MSFQYSHSLPITRLEAWRFAVVRWLDGVLSVHNIDSELLVSHVGTSFIASLVDKSFMRGLRRAMVGNSSRTNPLIRSPRTQNLSRHDKS